MKPTTTDKSEYHYGELGRLARLRRFENPTQYLEYAELCMRVIDHLSHVLALPRGVLVSEGNYENTKMAREMLRNRLFAIHMQESDNER